MPELIKSKAKIVGRFTVLDDEERATEDDYKTNLGLVLEFENAKELRKALEDGAVEFDF